MRAALRLGRGALWAAAALALTACAPRPENAGSRAPDADAWTPLFNGRDLTGWTPKIRGYPAGEDPLGTFRVVDGILTVSYDRYGPTFDGRFGHLFHEVAATEYVLRVEYRFVGEQLAGGETWAFENSGVMYHSQSPQSMLPDQDFPISLEAQFLGGTGATDRPTANLCTPGTEVEFKGARTQEHCINSTSRTYPAGEWVTVDVVVHGDRRIAHVIDGDTVLAYARPIIGGGVVTGYDPAAKPDGQPLTHGWIALQSESHPVQFRRILLRELAAGRIGGVRDVP